MKYRRNPQNLGEAGNYRCGFELSVGCYFRWSASDDLLSPNLLQSAVDVLDHHSTVFVAYPNKQGMMLWLIDRNQAHFRLTYTFTPAFYVSGSEEKLTRL